MKARRFDDDVDHTGTLAAPEYCGAARPVANKVANQEQVKKNSLLFVSVLTELHIPRFSRARDVLPFCGLIPPDQFVSNVQTKIITDAAATILSKAAKGVTR